MAGTTAGQTDGLRGPTSCQGNAAGQRLRRELGTQKELVRVERVHAGMRETCNCRDAITRHASSQVRRSFSSTLTATGSQLFGVQALPRLATEGGGLDMDADDQLLSPSATLPHTLLDALNNVDDDLMEPPPGLCAEPTGCDVAGSDSSGLAGEWSWKTSAKDFVPGTLGDAGAALSSSGSTFGGSHSHSGLTRSPVVGPSTNASSAGSPALGPAAWNGASKTGWTGMNPDALTPMAVETDALGSPIAMEGLDPAEALAMEGMALEEEDMAEFYVQQQLWCWKIFLALAGLYLLLAFVSNQTGLASSIPMPALTENKEVLDRIVAVEAAVARLEQRVPAAGQSGPSPAPPQAPTTPPSSQRLPEPAPVPPAVPAPSPPSAVQALVPQTRVGAAKLHLLSHRSCSQDQTQQCNLGFIKEMEAMKKEADTAPQIQERHLYTSLPDELMNDPRWQQHVKPKVRGRGYWFWKAAISRLLLAKGVLQLGDDLLYVDADSMPMMKHLIRLSAMHKQDIIIAAQPHCEHVWTKGDIFQRFGTTWNDLHYGLTQQPKAQAFYMRLNERTLKVLQIWEMLMEDFHLEPDFPCDRLGDRDETAGWSVHPELGARSSPEASLSWCRDSMQQVKDHMEAEWQKERKAMIDQIARFRAVLTRYSIPLEEVSSVTVYEPVEQIAMPVSVPAFVLSSAAWLLDRMLHDAMQIPCLQDPAADPMSTTLPIALLAILHCAAAEDVEANTFNSYLQEQVCQACKDLDPEDKAILEGVAAVERAHLHDVVLYHALPFDVYTLAWIWHGISNEDMLTWKPLDRVQTPYPAAAMRLALRVFHKGQQFPLFKAPDLKLCWPVSGRPSVRETGGQFVGTVTSVSQGSRSITVEYDQESKQYVPDATGCFPLVDTARESQAKALTDEELIKNGVSSATSFKSYLTKLGIIAQDGQDGTKPDHVPGASERLLALNLNAFGSWQVGPRESSWDQFRMNGISFASAAGLGGQLPFLKDIFDERKLSANVQEVVLKQLQLLVCVVKNRTIEPGTVTGCDSLVADMKTLISCPTATDLTELMSTALPPSASACKKVITTVPGAPSTKCGTDVLLQLVMTPDLANDLAYLSSEGGAPDSARDEGESFVRGYNGLKNTPSGDNVQVRSLLRRDPFASGSGLQFAAHSSVFRDTTMMSAVAGIASDIRDTVLGHSDACWTTTSTTTSTTTTTTGEVRPPFFRGDVHPLRFALIMLLAGLSVAALCYYRLQRAAPARDLRAIEMQEHAKVHGHPVDAKMEQLLKEMPAEEEAPPSFMSAKDVWETQAWRSGSGSATGSGSNPRRGSGASGSTDMPLDEPLRRPPGLAMFPHAKVRTGSEESADAEVSVSNDVDQEDSLADPEVLSRVEALQKSTSSALDDRAQKSLGSLEAAKAMEVLQKVEELVEAQGGECRNLSSMLQSVCRKMERKMLSDAKAKTLEVNPGMDQAASVRPTAEESKEYWTVKRIEKAAERAFETWYEGDRWRLKFSMAGLDPSLSDIAMERCMAWLRRRLAEFKDASGPKVLRQCRAEWSKTELSASLW
eukprot:s1592_g4.t2